MSTQSPAEHHWRYPGPDERLTTTQADHGNLWNDSVVAAGGVSNARICPRDTQQAAVFGDVSAATTISLRISADGSHFFTIATATPGAGSDFAFTNLQLPGGAQVMLVSSAAATITATALLKT